MSSATGAPVFCDKAANFANVSVEIHRLVRFMGSCYDTGIRLSRQKEKRKDKQMETTLFRKRALQGGACIYLVWTRVDCLYVGMSRKGLFRPFSNCVLRHYWEEIDCIQVEWCESIEDAVREECRAIRDLRPRLNKTLNVQCTSTESEFMPLDDKIEAAKRLGISRATLYRRIKAARESRQFTAD